MCACATPLWKTRISSRNILHARVSARLFAGSSGFTAVKLQYFWCYKNYPRSSHNREQATSDSQPRMLYLGGAPSRKTGVHQLEIRTTSKPHARMRCRPESLPIKPKQRRSRARRFRSCKRHCPEPGSRLCLHSQPKDAEGDAPYAGAVVGQRIQGVTAGVGSLSDQGPLCRQMGGGQVPRKQKPDTGEYMDAYSARRNKASARPPPGVKLFQFRNTRRLLGGANVRSLSGLSRDDAQKLQNFP